MARGIALRDAGDFEAAEAAFKAVLAERPGFPHGWRELGVLYALRGAGPEAADCFRAAVRADGDALLFRLSCARHLTSMGETGEADAVLAGCDPATDKERDRVAFLRDVIRFVGTWPDARAPDLAQDDVAEPQTAHDGVWLERAEDAILLAQNGIALREAGDLEAAEAAFKALIVKHPSLPYGWQELGVLNAQRGAVPEAADCYRAAVRADRTDLLFHFYCARHLTFMGETAEADEVLAGYTPKTDEERDWVASLRDAARFVEAWPEPRALELSRGVEEGGSYVDVRTIERAALTAASEGRGFSIIRVGDGEGAWLKLGPEDEQAYPELYAWNRKEFLRLWFNDDSLYDDARFHTLSARLGEAMDGASVLGMPYSLRVIHEYNVRSSRGVPSSVNALRWLQHRLAERPRLFCSQDVHIELQFAGSFRRILRAGYPVGLISCHADLPALVAERTGARVARFHAIPEEKGFSDILGFRNEAEPHFPSAFDRIMASLTDGSRRGEIWLVSAGYLGKLYCEAIRAGGGVALDIGSITDGWCGKITRPTLTEIERFAL